MGKGTVVIFGSGTIRDKAPGWQVAYEAGFCLAKEGFVVANGGYCGAMLASAKGAKEAGGSTIGVTTDEFPGSQKNAWIDREIRLPTWRERLHHLIGLGDGFVVLDGGTGTLTELLVIWEMLNKGLSRAPVAILGSGIQSAINALTPNPEVQIPGQMRLVATVHDAVGYLAQILRLA